MKSNLPKYYEVIYGKSAGLIQIRLYLFVDD